MTYGTRTPQEVTLLARPGFDTPQPASLILTLAASVRNETVGLGQRSDNDLSASSGPYGVARPRTLIPTFLKSCLS